MRRRHAEHLRLEPREVLTLRVAALEAERGARARLRHAERHVVNGAVRAERARVEEDAPRDRDFEAHNALAVFQRCRHCTLFARRRVDESRHARLERRERVSPAECEHACRVPAKGDAATRSASVQTITSTRRASALVAHATMTSIGVGGFARLSRRVLAADSWRVSRLKLQC